MRHDISQFAALRLRRDQFQRAFGGSTGTLNDAFAIQDDSTRWRIASSGQFSAFCSDRHAITRRLYHALKGQIPRLAKKPPLFHANMRHTARRVIKCDVRQDTTLAIRTKYGVAKMKFSHFGNAYCLAHTTNLALQ